MTTRTYLRELPKAEIHVHLEGCLEPETIERLAEEAGERLPRPRDKLMQFADLSDFLRFLDWSCSLVRTADQLTEAAYAFSRRMAVSGAGYADIIVNPTHWTHWHRRVGEMIEALDRGFAAAEHDGLPSVGLCASLLRTQTAARRDCARSSRQAGKAMRDSSQSEPAVEADRGEQILGRFCAALQISAVHPFPLSAFDDPVR